MKPGKRKPPKPQTRDAWKKKHQLLVFDGTDLMHCKLCEMGNKNRKLRKFLIKLH